ncbi:fumarylacetoacetate hydrolase [Rubrobacter marinus]|uniref:Fumarylacetoacetate hydrolase n=1 Tax=Rubrobacter marinus TaxID=2653852 RepID=A0A6G8Q0V1_9ACTN|nr:fumarylacetoacetate hydrolase family protein [Rubrobacter marinus]QIN79947.1 fumarylacetoacetate hydrolase [Rubrobacter marinus]
MRLTTICRDGREAAAIVTPEGPVPVGGLDGFGGGGADLFSLLESGRFHELKDLYDRGEVMGRAVPPEGVEPGPLYRRPRKIWGIGLNYVEHAGDLSETAPTGEPASFMRPDTTVIGPGDEVVLPPQSERVTAEGELAVVIGREARDVSEEEAPRFVAGFATVLDMTAEDILRRNPRYLTRSKSFDTFFSFGPELVTPDEVESVEGLEVSTVLNGEVLRANTVLNMTFSPYWLVAFHSRVMTLLPGDIISTGTPGAVVIRDGDVAGCRITGFRPLLNPVVR